jgi:hypothetical protein
MFSIAFMVMVFVLTQTVSHSFPKLCSALQRKFGTNDVYRAGRRYVFGLASRERITTNSTVLGSAPAMRRRLPNLEVAGLFGITHRTLTTPGAMRRPSSESRPNCWLFRRSSATRSCGGYSCR